MTERREQEEEERGEEGEEAPRPVDDLVGEQLEEPRLPCHCGDVDVEHCEGRGGVLPLLRRLVPLRGEEPHHEQQEQRGAQQQQQRQHLLAQRRRQCPL